MIHLMKLCVGVRDVATLQARPPRLHVTRSAPRRTADVIAGGSLYWVVSGVMAVRQRVLDITEEHGPDGVRCAGLVLDPALVPVEGRRVRAFQGWRYLDPDDAPVDVGDAPMLGELPAALRMQLRALCLL